VASNDIDEKLARATDLANRNEFSAALGLVEPLAASEPNNPRVLGVFAGLYFRQGKLEEASRYFRRATELSPKSELASLGLFHSLWGTGEHTSAEREIAR
jgi:predicted Zn-dependent protease